MTKTKNLFITVVMAAILLFSGLIPFGASNLEANALSPDYDDDLNTIYYFFDYYPSVDYETLNDEYGSNYNVVYDRISSYNLSTIFYSGYFSGFDANSIVIIDIKLIKPDTDLLCILFDSLKNQGCQTVYVTIFNETDYRDNSFVNFVDIYFVSNFSKLQDFFEEIVGLMEHEFNDTLNNSIILLDGNMVNLIDYYGDIDALCENSYFLSFLLNELAVNLNLTAGTYDEILTDLVEYHNIRLIVNKSDSEFIDLYTCDQYFASTVENLKESIETNNQTNYDNVGAIGFSSLQSYFYTFLYNGQRTFGNLPVYLLEADPIIYGSGLSIFTQHGINMTEEYLLLEEQNGLELE